MHRYHGYDFLMSVVMNEQQSIGGNYTTFQLRRSSSGTKLRESLVYMLTYIQ